MTLLLHIVLYNKTHILLYLLGKERKGKVTKRYVTIQITKVINLILPKL